MPESVRRSLAGVLFDAMATGYGLGAALLSGIRRERFEPESAVLASSTRGGPPAPSATTGTAPPWPVPNRGET
jgi:hypothetical protein